MDASSLSSDHAIELQCEGDQWAHAAHEENRGEASTCIETQHDLLKVRNEHNIIS